jgi:hypothetical protein
LQAEPILPSRRLERIASVLKDGRAHAIGDIADRFGKSGFGFVILLLALPALIPIPGPFGLVFGSCLALVSLQVLSGAEHLWLPSRMRKIEVDGGKLRNGIGHAADWLRWTEKWISPRRGPQWLLTHLRPVAGLPVLFLALIIAIPIPFGNIVPCVALLFFALGLIAEDGLALAAGLALGFVAVGWTVFLFVAGGNLAGSVLSMAGWN